MCIYLEPEEDREGKTEVRGEDSINRLLRKGEVFFFILKRKDTLFPFLLAG